MSDLKIDPEAVIKAYNEGVSMTSIARAYGTHTTTILRLLKKQNVKLRHDIRKKGTLFVKNGDKLIEWAKAQGRPVTKAELAKIAGTKRLSPSYFIKYPELGQYVVTHGQNDLQDYSKKLYDWLQANDIQYKPNDRTRLKMAITALLLGEYKDLALEIGIKPKYISRRKHEETMREKIYRANEEDVSILWLYEDDFKDLDKIKEALDVIKK